MSLEQVLQRFGYTSFRPLQREIMTDMLDGHDMIILLPTGAGKSLCYQVPALYQGGLTVVISPLISLIYDQVQDLKNHGILAHYLCTGAPCSIDTIFNDIKNQECHILYITPEAYNNNIQLRMLLEETKDLRRFIIDEVHCLSNWGHDFRPEYLKLDTKKPFPEIPVCGFTATATNLVCADIIDRLKLSEPTIWKTGYVKNNISYKLQYKEKSSWGYLDSLVYKFINAKSDACGIVYCLSRKQCEHLAGFLSSKGIKAGYYHAQVPAIQKTKTQQDWLDGKIKVIVATIAFALGINKPDVRYVIHTSMPNSIEGYYQQAGRAGRDGKPSVAILYYSEQDKQTLENMIDYEVCSNEAPVAPLERINHMYNLCINNKDCVKVQLSNYLGEYDVKNCIGRKDSSPCYVCQEKTLSVPDGSAVSKVLKLINTNRPDLQAVRQSARSITDYRALNYLLNNGVLKTAVVNSKNGRSEIVYADQLMSSHPLDT